MAPSRSRRRFVQALLLGSLATGAAAELAQARSSAKNMAFSLPLVSSDRGATGHAEYNLGGQASLAVELAYVAKGEDLTETEIDEIGGSRITHGREVAIFVSRYTDGARMSGFFWSLGAGYRQVDGSWVVAPDRNDPDVDLTLVDEQEMLRHELTMAGVTGHGRVGYTYVADQWPLLVGAYLGVRHFQVGVQDREVQGQDRQVSPLTDHERARLRRDYMTALAPGVSIGLTF